VPTHPRGERHRRPILQESIDPETRAYVVRLIWEHLSQHPEIAKVVAAEVGAAGGRTLDAWARWITSSPHEPAAGAASARVDETYALKVENRQLREGIAVLGAAVSHFLAELPATQPPVVARRARGRHRAR